eukprot:48866-Chlamydomonas_euryale.AAC.1
MLSIDLSQLPTVTARTTRAIEEVIAADLPAVIKLLEDHDERVAAAGRPATYAGSSGGGGNGAVGVPSG